MNYSAWEKELFRRSYIWTWLISLWITIAVGFFGCAYWVTIMPRDGWREFSETMVIAFLSTAIAISLIVLKSRRKDFYPLKAWRLSFRRLLIVFAISAFVTELLGFSPLRVRHMSLIGITLLGVYVFFILTLFQIPLCYVRGKWVDELSDQE